MVSRSDLIMTVSLDAFNRVVWVIVELVQHLLVHLVINWHRLLPRKQAIWPSIPLLFEPRVASDFIDPVPLVGVSV